MSELLLAALLGIGIWLSGFASGWLHRRASDRRVYDHTRSLVHTNPPPSTAPPLPREPRPSAKVPGD